MELDYRGLGMADWRDVIDGFVRSEPCRPFTTRGMSKDEKFLRVAAELGISRENPIRQIQNFEGRLLQLNPLFASKLASFANHAAYTGWIEESVLHPLEVWEHPDPRSDDPNPRQHYFAAYVGPKGATSHLVVATTDGILINGFRLDNVSSANEKRFGQLAYVGYSPEQPPLPVKKGAPFPIAPFSALILDYKQPEALASSRAVILK